MQYRLFSVPADDGQEGEQWGRILHIEHWENSRYPVHFPDGQSHGERLLG